MEIVKGLGPWFQERLIGLSWRPETLAYVVGVLKDQAHPSDDGCLAKRSIVLEFYDAKMSGSFVRFQRIGDWVLFASVYAPNSLKEREVAENLARLSYYACYRIMGKEWAVYEELADQLPAISSGVRSRLLLV